MFVPSVDFLRQVVHPAICGASAEIIKISASPSAVYRVGLAYDEGTSAVHEAAVPTVIIKHIRRNWPGDDQGHNREVNFYNMMSGGSGLPLARIYYAGEDPINPSHRIVVLEDLSKTHYFPKPTHHWTASEVKQILRAYACFHVEGIRVLPPLDQRAWLFARYEDRVVERAQELSQMANDLISRGIWESLPGFSELVAQTLANIERWADHPATLLHNDVYPPNAGLPRQQAGGGTDQVVLLDWEMVGWGLAETDLAYMALQPFGSSRRVDRVASLDYYWQQREFLEGRRPSQVELQARQHHADALMALWLIPIAHRVALSPFPPGSAPRAYWDAMFPVLGERLNALCLE